MTKLKGILPNVMAITQGERLATLEEHMRNQDKKLEHIDSQLDALDSKFDKFIEELDSRYASKNVERIVYGMVSIILVAVIYAILRLIGIK